LLIIGIGSFGAAQAAGFHVNINEVAGPYAGMLYGMSNTLATVPGIVAPYLVAILTKNQLQDEWSHVFYISAVIFGASGLFYLTFSSCDLQPWARDDEPQPQDNNNNENDMTFRPNLD